MVRTLPGREPVEVPPPPEFDPAEVARREFALFTEGLDAMYDDLSGLPPAFGEDNPLTLLSVSSLMPLSGRQEDVLDASLNRFRVYKNLVEYVRQARDFDPESMRDLEGTKLGATVNSATVDPLQAMFAALDDISKEYPDNYTQFVASDAGLVELWGNALTRMMSPAKAEWSALPGAEGFPLSVAGGNLADSIDANMPDIPIVKGSLINAIEIASDPMFILAMTIFPPAGLAAKAALGTALVGGMAVGEEAAEEVGLPGIVGALPGGLLAAGGLGVARGFTRAALRDRSARSAWRPVRGEPATEMLIAEGKLPADLGELGAMAGERRVYFRGTSTNQEAALGEGAFLTASAKDAEVYAGVNVRAHGGKPVVQTVVVDEGAVISMSAEESLAGARGGVRVANPEGVRALQPGELPFPPMAGGATGPSIEGFRLKIRAHIERPEARDFLRLMAGKVANWVPMGGGKRLQEIINRLAVADEPALKAAFGWQFQLAEDNAARWMTMAPFRGSRVPFIENAAGQIWVPTKAPVSTGLPARALTRFEASKAGNLFRRGEGEWVAGGDVFESVMRGEKTYLGRLTEEQLGFISQARAAMEPHISFAEQATGMTIKKRDVWWPRFAVDPESKLWSVTAGARRGKPPALFQRQFEVQQEAIAEYGIKYRPGLLNQMEGAIEGMQKLTRDSLMGRYMKEEGILRFGKGPRITETYATELGTTIRGIVSKAHAREIMTVVGQGTKNPVIVLPQKVNAVARLMLTGTLDTGWGAIQLVTLAALNPTAWGEAMARGFYNALIEPKQFYRWMAGSPAAQRYAMYGGDMGFTSELMEAARMGGLGLPRAPVVSPVLDVATFPMRSFINRMTVGFDASLSYGRVLAFDTMAEVATKPGLLVEAMGARLGARPLEGAALHEELFRLARFTDTLIGQPKLGGVISASQHQAESAFVWFATRYTRSFLGTLSYALGRGYTPAQARAIIAKMLVGGASIVSGLIAARGVSTGKSQDEIFDEIKEALNPAGGKKFMSMKIGKDWYGLGGTYRAGFALAGGLANKDNWEFENWEEALVQNPIVRGWRSRAAPFTGQMMNFGPSLAGLLTGNTEIEGSDFLGYSVNISEMVDDPRVLGDYALDNFAPITLDALLQGGSIQRGTPRFIAEFFGLRTSPETAWEALEPVLNRVSQYAFGVPWSDLENNTPAQDLVRNNPDVVAVTEGRVRPIRDRPQERFWRRYREGRETIAETHVETRQRVEDSYTAGRMNGSDYREQYGEAQAAEYFELRGFREGLGVDFTDQGVAPTGTVNSALDAYYAVDLDDYRDKDTLVPDWEAFFADRDAALAQVPEEFLPLVETWLRRRETEVRRHMRGRFEEVVEPTGYLRMREEVSVALGISLDDLEAQIVKDFRGKDRRASPGDVARLTDKYLNMMLESAYGDGAPSISELRQTLREINPVMDAELFRQGFTTTVRSEAAQEYLRRSQQKWPDMGYFEAPLSGDIAERLKRERR
jgi:hypothetical protein